MLHRLLAAAAWCLLIAAAPAGPAGPAGAETGEPERVVLVTTIDAEITPVIANQLCDGVGKAAEAGAEAYVVRLDTPGGLDTAMRDIVSCFLTASVPVAVHVAPSGSRAASAGAIITLASHVAAMAPGTAIGAATPVGLDGSDLSDKVVNDAAALAASIAETRDRDVDVAVAMVREDVLAATDALDRGVVDLISPDLAALLADLDGWEVELADGSTVVARTDGAVVERFDLSWTRQILQWLANPNLTFLLLSIGALGIVYELANPGIGAGGVVGVIAIVVALFSLSVLPVDAVGLLLFGLAVVLFVGELFVPGTGVLAALGVASLAASSLFLFDRGVGARVAPAMWIPTVAVVGGVLLAGWLVTRARTRPSWDSLVGTRLDPERVDPVKGEAVVAGAWWRVRRSDGRALGGDGVLEVVDVDGLTLVVAPVEDPSVENEPEEKTEP